MTSKTITGGTVHEVPVDLKIALSSDYRAYVLWEGLTPLARNEWICWTIMPKQEKTRKEHVERVVSELKDGMRRPCCWLGCIHRKDKELSKSVKGILSKRK